MWVAVLRMDIHIPGARSRKDRRQVVRSLKERLRSRFSVGCAEVGNLDSWSRASLGVTTCANEKAELDRMVESILQFARQHPEGLVGPIEKDIFRFDGKDGKDGKDGEDRENEEFEDEWADEG